MTDPGLAPKLLASVEHYRETNRWWPSLFLLMPDHLHALVAVPLAENLRVVVGDWKRFHTSRHGVHWQENFFDHRIRHDESYAEKYHYILQNPVARRLVSEAADWPWVYRAD